MEQNYEEIMLFEKPIKIRNYFCSENPNFYKMGHLRVNLYIKINDNCNANCKFCSNNKIRDNGRLDLNKLKEILIYLNKKNIINKISITGGEPLLNIELLNEVLNLIFLLKPTSVVTINTNGYNLKNILDLDSLDKIEGIHISRHHYNNNINNNIFGFNMPTDEDIKYVQSKLKNKRLLRLNCLLMKNYISNIDEVNKYLEFASDIGISIVGFVSLMKENEYCEENFIDFNDVFNENNYINRNNCNLKHLYGKNICECLNGTYISNQGKFIEYYARITKETKCEYLRQLVYTSDNRLTTGFGEETII